MGIPCMPIMGMHRVGALCIIAVPPIIRNRKIVFSNKANLREREMKAACMRIRGVRYRKKKNSIFYG